jgi:hypothetical protein
MTSRHLGSSLLDARRIMDETRSVFTSKLIRLNTKKNAIVVFTATGSVSDKSIGILVAFVAPILEYIFYVFKLFNSETKTKKSLMEFMTITVLYPSMN